MNEDKMKKMKILSYFYRLVGSPVLGNHLKRTWKKYIIPKRITLSSSPAMYCWLGIIFTWDNSVRNH